MLSRTTRHAARLLAVAITAGALTSVTLPTSPAEAKTGHSKVCKKSAGKKQYRKCVKAKQRAKKASSTVKPLTPDAAHPKNFG